MGDTIPMRVKVHSIDGIYLEFFHGPEYTEDDLDSARMTLASADALDGAEPGDIVEVVFNYDSRDPVVYARRITGTLDERVEALEAIVAQLQDALAAQTHRTETPVLNLPVVQMSKAEQLAATQSFAKVFAQKDEELLEVYKAGRRDDLAQLPYPKDRTIAGLRAVYAAGRDTGPISVVRDMYTQETFAQRYRWEQQGDVLPFEAWLHERLAFIAVVATARYERDTPVEQRTLAAMQTHITRANRLFFEAGDIDGDALAAYRTRMQGESA